jgi:hypothetical protein
MVCVRLSMPSAALPAPAQQQTLRGENRMTKSRSCALARTVWNAAARALREVA